MPGVQRRAHRASAARPTCRVPVPDRHVFAVDDLIAAKEELLEARLWTTFRSLHELTHLLGAVARLAGEAGLPDAAARLLDRAARARRHADELRWVIEDSTTVDTSDVGQIEVSGERP